MNFLWSILKILFFVEESRKPEKLPIHLIYASLHKCKFAVERVMAWTLPMCSLAKWCLTLCDPMDCSPPGSSVPGISQVRRLEWFAISFSTGSSWPWDLTQAFCIGWWVLYRWVTRKPSMDIISLIKKIPFLGRTRMATEKEEIAFAGIGAEYSNEC